MPTYGEEKRRDMIRSILPSTARKGARKDRSLAHRRHRAAVRSEIQNHILWEDEIDNTAVADIRRRKAIQYMMWDRRGADKIGPICHWGYEVTKHLPEEDRLNTLRSWLPDNTIGRHAISHLRNVDGLEDPSEPYRYWRYFSNDNYTVRQEEEKELFHRQVTLLVEHGYHAELNRRVKGEPMLMGNRTFDAIGRRVHVIPKEENLAWGLLEGLHDIDAFVDRVFRRVHMDLSPVEALVKKLIAEVVPF
jgi:hypothetical protein